MELNIKLDRQSKKPLFVQIAEQIITDINSGIIKDGTRLTAERKLAALLGVNRSTIINAYRELGSKGYVTSHVGSGTIVEKTHNSEDNTDKFIWQELLSGQGESLINPYNSTMAELLAQNGLIGLDLGIADPDHYPKKELAEIITEILLAEGDTLLQHSSPQGLMSLRESLVNIMELRGIHTHTENVIVLNGSQQGLDLVCRLLLEPGDSVFVEEQSFLGAIDIFRAYGVRLVSIPTDADGLIIEALEKALKRTKPKFIYTIPTYQNPTGSSLESTRRKAVLNLAIKYQVPILEDDPYGLIYFNDKYVPALKAHDNTECVIYLSSFSKLLGNGLRLGWMVAPTEIVRLVVAAKQINDMHTSNVLQRAIDVYYRRGFFEDLLQIIRAKYQMKRDCMLEALSKYAPQDMKWNIPEGGYYIWATLPDGLSALKVFEVAVNNKVSFVAGPVFYSSEGGSSNIRLNYSFAGTQDITKGIKILCEVIKDMKKKIIKPKKILDTEYRPIV